ncbi:unnamed protein product [Clavelina lepadiformis]|uniref:Uncharacterized protein n=1 Tax=Clavelina lepadiformis TaxID=159417 RepID=A0ABP0F091_CLALP
MILSNSTLKAFGIGGPATLGVDKHRIKDGRCIYEETDDRLPASIYIHMRKMDFVVFLQSQNVFRTKPENEGVYPAGSEVPRVRTQPKKVSENDLNEQHSDSENEIQGWKWKDQSKDSTENQGKPGT